MTTQPYASADRAFWIVDNGSSHRGQTSVQRMANAWPTAHLVHLRYRLLHVAARLTHGQRRRWLRIQHSWPWAHQLVAAFTRLTTLPIPTG